MVKEAEITKAIRDYLKLKGIFHWKNHQGLGSTPGVSDIIGIYKKKFLGIEIKTARGKLNENQKNFLIEVNKQGGIGFIARSVEDVIVGLGDMK